MLPYGSTYSSLPYIISNAQRLSEGPLSDYEQQKYLDHHETGLALMSLCPVLLETRNIYCIP